MHSMPGFTDESVPDQSGKCFIVTGANTGIGFEASRVLAGKGARVLMACRNEAKALEAMERIQRGIANADLAFVLLDQANLASVRAAAEAVSREARIDGLINNAGVMASTTAYTSDGFEQHMGVNHLATYALTLLLVAKLAQTPGARIVVTSSLVHKAGAIDFDNLARGEGAKPSELYSQSKLANLLFLLELDRRLREASLPILAVGCHPGLAATELSRDISPAMRLLKPLLSRLVNSALQGAWPTLQAATAPAIEAGGYYGPQSLGGARGVSGPARRSARSRSPELASRLWAVSADLTGVGPDILHPV